jgi:hypothetical protein
MPDLRIRSTLTTADARDLIAHGCDGPVTRFVAINRALELAALGANQDALANALHELLPALGDEAYDAGS